MGVEAEGMGVVASLLLPFPFPLAFPFPLRGPAIRN